MLPNLIGLGAPRCGTTWLHYQLDRHPDILMATRRKEVHYFDFHYAKGPDWYRRFFPTEGGPYRVSGEITPYYLYCRDCPDRMADYGKIERFIVILRDPVARAYSHYGLKVRNWRYRRPFMDFVDETDEGFEFGRYARYLRRYFDQFGRDRFLVVVYEEMFADLDAFGTRLAGFLDVPVSGFQLKREPARTNRSFVPYLGAGYKAAMHAVKWLNRNDHEWVVRIGKRLGIKSLLARGTSLPPLSDTDRRALAARYAGDVAELEDLLGRPLPWGARGEVPVDPRPIG